MLGHDTHPCRCQQARASDTARLTSPQGVYLSAMHGIPIVPVGVAQCEHVDLGSTTQFANHVDQHRNAPVVGIGAESRYDEPDFHRKPAHDTLPGCLDRRK